MSITKYRLRRSGAPSQRAQAGVAAVEFALVGLLFFSCIFSMIEIARALYLWNTLQEVTRRAARGAAVSNFADPDAMDQVRQDALLDHSKGALALIAPVTDAHVRIDYLSIQRAANGSLTLQPITGALPGCPARNVLNCVSNAYAPGCIRFVRARVCQSADVADPAACVPLEYASFTGLFNLPVHLPVSLTMVKAESLGYQTGDALCP